MSTLDKYEYKVRADEIKALIAEGEYAEAVKIADTIDWRRVKSVMMLCTISDLYKINRRYTESKDILLLAYEKHPTGRLIVYSLCELSIKMEEYVQAIEYYKEFVQIAPKDTGRYILQYRLYEAQDVSLEERIAVLEEFKKRDYREKWAYELAYLYHRIGLSTKCVEECDEMFLWFGEGKYVIKALELKALHQPLNDEQQEKYDLWMQAKETAGEPYEEDSGEDNYDGSEDTREDGYGQTEEVQEEPMEAEVPTMELPEVKTVDLGQYNTINLQMALAESMREILSEEEEQPEVAEEESEAPEVFFEQEDTAEFPAEDTGYEESEYTEDTAEPEYTEYEGEPVGYEETEDVSGVYEEAEENPAIYETAEEPSDAYGAAEEDAAEYEETGEIPVVYEETEETPTVYEETEEPPTVYEEAEEVPATHEETEEAPAAETSFAGSGDPAEDSAPYEEAEEMPPRSMADREPALDDDTAELDDDAITKSLIAPLLEETIRLPDHREVEKKLKKASVAQFPKKAAVKEPPAREAPERRKPVMDTDNLQEISAQIVQEDTAAIDAQQILEQMKQETQKRAEKKSDVDKIPGARTGVLTPLNAKPSKYDNILAQEYDGQLSLVMPEAERVEKQITGQLSIEDIMAEWEEMKKTNEEKRMEDVRQRILQHTGNLFADFDEATKNGLLEELERAFVAAIMKESGRKPAIKKVILPEDTDRKPAFSKRAEPEPVLHVSDDEAEDVLMDETEADEAGFPEEMDEPAYEESAVSDAEEPAREFGTGDEMEGEEQHEIDDISDRELTDEEKELFGEFIHHRKTERQLVRTLDNMSLSPYTGNVLITGEEEETSLQLAKALIREMQLNDNNFSGKVAKISGTVLNKKDVDETFGRLDNGALIIEKASRLKPPTAVKMARALDRDNMGLLVLMVDKKQSINQLIAENTELADHFNLRVDIEALDDEALVAYAKQYAEEMEYSIDEFGILALHTRIADRQTSDHEVNLAEVRDLVDEAIYHANKKTPGHFMDILLAKRYDEDDMIILREKDFMHY